jgi:hypothetical protein
MFSGRRQQKQNRAVNTEMSEAKTIEVMAAVLIDPAGKPVLIERTLLSPATWPRGHRYAALLTFVDGITGAELEPGVGTPEIVQAVTAEFAALVRERIRAVPLEVRELWVNTWKASQSPRS